MTPYGMAIGALLCFLVALLVYPSIKHLSEQGRSPENSKPTDNVMVGAFIFLVLGGCVLLALAGCLD